MEGSTTRSSARWWRVECSRQWSSSRDIYLVFLRLEMFNVNQEATEVQALVCIKLFFMGCCVYIFVFIYSSVFCFNYYYFIFPATVWWSWCCCANLLSKRGREGCYCIWIWMNESSDGYFALVSSFVLQVRCSHFIEALVLNLFSRRKQSWFTLKKFYYFLLNSYWSFSTFHTLLWPKGP